MAYTRISQASYSGSYAGQQIYTEYQILSTNSANNTYRVRFQLVGFSGSGSASWNASATPWTFSVGGSTWTGTTSWDYRSANTHLVFKTVDQTISGGQLFTVSGSHQSGTTLGNASTSFTMSLATLTASETDAKIRGYHPEMGDTRDFRVIIQKPTNGTANLYLSRYDGTVGTFWSKANVAEDAIYNINGGADALWRAYPNARQVACTLTLGTMRAGQLVATDERTVTFTCDGAEPDPPSISVVDINTAAVEKTGSNTNYIPGYSTVKVSVTAAAAPKKHATLSKYLIECDGKRVESTEATPAVIFTNVRDAEVTVTAVDSRGSQKSASASLTSYPYQPCGFQTAAVVRSNTGRGKTAEVTYELIGEGTVTYRYKLQNGSWSEPAPATAPHFSIPAEIPETETCDVELTVSDGLSTAQALFTVGVAFVPMKLMEDGKFSYSIENYIENSSGDRKTIKEGRYPVGYVYISMVDESPASFWGGTWTPINGRFLLAQDTSHPAGTTGGHETLDLRALIGATGGNAGAVGYTAKDAVSGFTASYAVTGTIYGTKTYNHSTQVVDATQKSTATSIMPPYLSVYMWYRSA